MFNYVQRVDSIEISLYRTSQEVMLPALELPMRIHAAQYVGHEGGIEIGGGQALYLLHHEASPERVGASYFENMVPASEHLGDKLIPSQGEDEVTGVVSPGLVRHQPQRRHAALARQFQGPLVLRFSGYVRF